jgi:hypothetical protein
MNNMKTVLFFIALCIIPARQADAVTEKSGTVNREERWTIENGPYLITGDILVPRNSRLYIEPGTKVIAGKPRQSDSGITQFDHLDSFTVSIRVEGTIICAGKAGKRISFCGETGNMAQCEWYGIVLDGIISDQSEISFTDISGSCNGLVVKKGAPVVHHCVFEKNNVGVTVNDGSRVKIINCAIAGNSTAGIRVSNANPVIYNCVIAYNKMNGVWSDGTSHIALEYNLLYGNPVGDLSGCDPELGILKKINENKDSVDVKFNLFENPVFVGAEAESLAMEHDPALLPRKSQVKDTAVAKALAGAVSDAIPFKRVEGADSHYKPSRYSPCINAGHKAKQYNDPDKTRNDIGIYGGPEFYKLE